VILTAFSLQIWITNSNLSNWIAAHIFWSFLGVLFCFYFIYAEIVIGALCPLCTVVHILCFINFGLSLKLFSPHNGVLHFMEFIKFFIINKYHWIILILIIHLLPLIYFNLVESQPIIKPLPVNTAALDSFSKCLKFSGVIMYGSNECHVCLRQKEVFGPSFQFVDYVNCGENELRCAEKGVSAMPTWIKVKENGTEIKRHTGLLTLKELEVFGACKLSEDV